MQQAVPSGDVHAPGADGNMAPVVWREDASADRIEFDRQMIESVRFECSRAMNGIGGTGIGGVLLGSCEGDVLRVSGWRPLDCDHSRGPAFLMSERDLAGVAALIEGLDAQSSEGGPGVAGCFISHPREGLAPTSEELAWHARFFGPGLPLIIIQPDRLGAIECAVYRDSAKRRGDVFEVDPLPVAKREPGERRRRRGPSPVVAQPRPAGVVPQAAEPKRWWPWAVALAVIGIIVIGTLLARTRRTPAPQAVTPGDNTPVEVMSLHARPSGKKMAITWNGKADSVPYIQTAALVISDGGKTVRIPLSRTEIHAGKYLYGRIGSDMHIRLVLRGANGQEFEESTVYRDPSAARSTAEGVTLDVKPSGRP